MITRAILVIGMSVSLSAGSVFADLNLWEAGTSSAEFEALWVKESNPAKPSYKFLSNFLKPLNQVDLPFDLVKVSKSIEPTGAFVAYGWQLTTLHRLPIQTMGDVDIFLGESSYLPLELKGVGKFLFIVGHPRLPHFKQQGLTFTQAIDKIPLEERPDLGLFKITDSKKDYLKVAESIQVGEQVYLVHSPFLNWLSPEENDRLRQNLPLVSSGRVIAIRGHAAIVDILAFQGSSGGTVVNRQGEVVGILSVSLSRPNAPPYAGFMVLDEKMKAIIKVQLGISSR